MTFLWPGIGKIQVDPVYLTFSENLRKILGIDAEVTEIREFFSAFFCEKFPFLKGAVENACVALDADIVDLRISSGKLRDKLTFSHADFDVEWLFLAENLIPVTFFGCRVLNDPGACGYGFVRTRYIS